MLTVVGTRTLLSGWLGPVTVTRSHNERRDAGEGCNARTVTAVKTLDLRLAV